MPINQMPPCWIHLRHTFEWSPYFLVTSQVDQSNVAKTDIHPVALLSTYWTHVQVFAATNREYLRVSSRFIADFEREGDRRNSSKYRDDSFEENRTFAVEFRLRQIGKFGGSPWILLLTHFVCVFFTLKWFNWTLFGCKNYARNRRREIWSWLNDLL